MRKGTRMTSVESEGALSYSEGTCHSFTRTVEVSMPTQTLESFLSGRWSRGEGVETTLVDPVSGEALATASARGLDLAGALAFARREGQGALRGLGYAARAKLVGAVADVLLANRAKYEAIAIANSGNTKDDAGIGIDGGIGKVKYSDRLAAGHSA